MCKIQFSCISINNNMSLLQRSYTQSLIFGNWVWRVPLISTTHDQAWVQLVLVLIILVNACTKYTHERCDIYFLPTYVHTGTSVPWLHVSTYKLITGDSRIYPWGFLSYGFVTVEAVAAFCYGVASYSLMIYSTKLGRTTVTWRLLRL